MENRLQSELTNKIAEGIKRGIERMIDYKIKNGGAIIIYTEEGGLQKISGPDLEKHREVRIRIGNDDQKSQTVS